jgi:hypothetical protein
LLIPLQLSASRHPCCCWRTCSCWYF